MELSNFIFIIVAIVAAVLITKYLVNSNQKGENPKNGSGGGKGGNDKLNRN